MKTVIYETYGSIESIKIAEIKTPTPKNDEILIRVHASSVTTADWRIRTLTMPFGFGFLGRLIFGFKKPKYPVLGADLSGEITAIGKDVTNFKTGDLVVASTGMSMGCHAEYKCLCTTSMIVKKPDNLSHEEATSLVFGGTAAFDFLKNKGNIQPGDNVLIIGASGSVGVAAIQIAKYFGAKVTAVCSEKGKDIVLALGADYFLDYKKEDFIKHTPKYDIILDCIGLNSFSKNKVLLKKFGRLLLIVADLPTILIAPILSKTNDIKIFAGPQSETIENLNAILGMAKEGRLKPVIERIFTIEDAKKAHALVESRQKIGNVVIRF